MPPACADISFTSGTRQVNTGTTHGVPDGDVDFTAGLFTESASTSGSGVSGSFTADSSQFSFVFDTVGPHMNGSGHAESSVSATGASGYSTTANSEFEIFFTVTATGDYNFLADVDLSAAVSSFAGASFSFVELRDDTNSTVLANIFRNAAFQGSDSFSDTFTLFTGTNYRVRAQSLMSGFGGTPSPLVTAVGNWSFDLSPASIPEIGSSAMMSLACIGAAFGLWRGHQR
jgi:hypothetical protein